MDLIQLSREVVRLCWAAHLSPSQVFSRFGIGAAQANGSQSNLGDLYVTEVAELASTLNIGMYELLELCAMTTGDASSIENDVFKIALDDLKAERLRLEWRRKCMNVRMQHMKQKRILLTQEREQMLKRTRQIMQKHESAMDQFLSFPTEHNHLHRANSHSTCSI
jgi:hypothetical protein